MQAPRNGECLKLLLEIVKPILCPEALRLTRRFVRNHKFILDPREDVVFSVERIDDEGDA